MRCKAWIEVRQGKTKGRGEPVERVRLHGDAYVRIVPGVLSHPLDDGATKACYYPTPPHPNSVRCSGAIVAKVAAVDEPFMGGTNAAFDATFVCQRCGHTYHGLRMPRTEAEVSRILTEWVAALPDDGD